MLYSATCLSMPSIRARYSLMETGTLAWRNSRKKLVNIGELPYWLLALLSPCHERQTLEEMDVLLVLEQRAVQRRDQLLAVLRPQRLGRHVLDHQQLQPVEQLGGRWLLLEARHVADIVEDVQRLAQQVALQVGEVDVDDLGHDLAI